MIADFPSAFEMFQQPSDMPTDCHRHCACWDVEGECCDCGDKRSPEPIIVDAEDKPLLEMLVPENLG